MKQTILLSSYHPCGVSGPISHEEIQRFEKLVRQDPDGRAFARLADAYRKDGRLDRALEVLEAGLQKHPDYLSGHLVHARTLRGLNRGREAGSAFSRVLDLDPMNLIATRALAEIAEEERAYGEALEHYERLLQIDPQDEEVERRMVDLRDLVGVDPKGSQASPGPLGAGEALETPEPTSKETGAADSSPAVTWLNVMDEVDTELLIPEPMEPVEPAEQSGPEPEPVSEAGGEPDSEEPMELDDETGDFLAAVDSLIEESLGAPELEHPEAWPAESRGDEPGLEKTARAASWLTVGEPQTREPEPLEPELEPEPLEPELEPEPQTPEQAAGLAGWLTLDQDKEFEDVAEDRPGDGDLFTRTMADLYAAQGLHERAVEIYEELLTDLPADEELLARLERSRLHLRRTGSVSAVEPPIEPDVAAAPDVDSKSGDSQFFREWLRTLRADN